MESKDRTVIMKSLQPSTFLGWLSLTYYHLNETVNTHTKEHEATLKKTALIFLKGL